MRKMSIIKRLRLLQRSKSEYDGQQLADKKAIELAKPTQNPTPQQFKGSLGEDCSPDRSNSSADLRPVGCIYELYSRQLLIPFSEDYTMGMIMGDIPNKH